MTSAAPAAQRHPYPSPEAALRDLAGKGPERRRACAVALCTTWGPPAAASEAAWRALGEQGQELVPGLVDTMNTDPNCLTVETAGIALGVQGEDGLTELLSLTRSHDFVVRFGAYLGFEAAGARARWAVPTLVRLLYAEPFPLVVDTILRALGAIGGSEAERVLATIASDPAETEEYRRSAASALPGEEPGATP